jgi:hypothetical protein
MVRKHSNGTAAYKPIQNTFRNSIGPKIWSRRADLNR